MERLSAPERTREELRALMSGDLGTGAGRSDLVRLALRLIVEEALEGEVSRGTRVEQSWGQGSHRLQQARRRVGGRLMTEARWTVLVEAKRADGGTERIEIASLERNVSSPTPDDLGLRLAEAKELILRLQSFLAQDHVRQVSAVDRTCRCGSSRRLHDYRTCQVDTLFGRVVLRQPRWRSCGCDRFEPQPNSDHARRPSRASARLCHVAVPRARSVGASGIVRPLRPPSATRSSPHREARGAFGLRRDGVGR